MRLFEAITFARSSWPQYSYFAIDKDKNIYVYNTYPGLCNNIFQIERWGDYQFVGVLTNERYDFNWKNSLINLHRLKI